VGHFLKEAIESGEQWPAHYSKRMVRDGADPPHFSHVECTPTEFAESLLSPDHISTLLEVPLLGRYSGMNVVMLEEHTYGHWTPTRYAHRSPDEFEISANFPAKQHPVLSPDHATIVFRVQGQDRSHKFQLPKVGVVESFRQTVKGTKLRTNAKLIETLGEVQSREMEALARVVEVVRGHGIDESLLPEDVRDILPVGQHHFPSPADSPYMVVSTYDTIPDGNCLYR
jgi:hypothetical protein